MRNFLLLFAFIPFWVSAQTGLPGAEVSVISPDAEIYNGRQHVDYLPATGSPYYLNNEWQRGAIMYHDIYYPSVWLKYDLVQKEVIIRHSNGIIGVTLFTPRVQYFVVSGKNFIRVSEKDSLALPKGIYEEVKKGKMSFYILRSKFLLETATPYGMERNFLNNESYYVIKNGIAFKIVHQKDILQLAKDKRKDIRADLKKKGLRYRSNREATLTGIVTYYNENSN
jgi:hypothetical protein